MIRSEIMKLLLDSKFNKIIEKLLIILLFFFIIILLIWRFQLGISRYFDIDEFAYLRWTHNILIGLKPYSDFFFLLPPTFLCMLSPLFLIFPNNENIILLARGFSFIFFFLTAVLLFLLTKKVRNFKTALFALFIFVFLPIPSDKWLEIRPDIPALFFTLLGIYFLINGIMEKKAKKLFLSGMFYGIGVIIIQKTLFLLLFAFLIVLIWQFFLITPLPGLIRKFSFKTIINLPICYLILGLILPIIFLLISFIPYGDFRGVFYFLTALPSFVTSTLGSKFPIPPEYYFYSSDILYGKFGYNLPWITNIFVWVVASLWLFYKFISSFFNKNKVSGLVEILLSGSFIVSLIIYVWFFPLHHEQYLLPLSIFIAFYAGDIIYRFYRFGAFGKIIVLFFIIIIFFGGKEMYDIKLSWSDQGFSYYKNLYNKFSSNEAVFDLTGETIFTKEGYYFCCLPYGSFAESLGFSLPLLSNSLKNNKVKYIYIKNEGRLFELPPHHQDFIRMYYTYEPNIKLNSYLILGNTIYFEGGEQKEINILLDGEYKIYWNNSLAGTELFNGEIIIDGKNISESFIFLTAGKHIISTYLPGEIKIIIKS